MTGPAGLMIAGAPGLSRAEAGAIDSDLESPIMMLTQRVCPNLTHEVIVIWTQSTRPIQVPG